MTAARPRAARRLLCAALVAMLLGPISSAVAAESDSGRGARSVDVRPHPGGLVQAEWLHRRTVRDVGGRDLGRVEEVWLDPKDGRVKELVVSVGGVLGLGEKHRILPWQDVKIAWEKQDLVVVATEEALRRAPVQDTEDRGQQPAASPSRGR
jgi:sporulation protein YlmC with PRC-barrel domain